MNFSTISGFAMEKSEIQYTGFWDWFVAFNDVSVLWKAQKSYLFTQLLVIIGSFVVLYHALKNGGRFIHLWMGIILHGLVVETVSYNLPDIDNFWHSQSPIIFLGRRLPLYIILIYTVFIYPASIAVDKLNLPKWSEPFAVGLVTVLIDYPYDVIGVRYMHWTWHDTDPNISDRHYYVPWTSFYFHATFAASFTFWFHFTRFIVFGKTKKWDLHRSFLKESGCTIIAALLGMPGGVLLFIPIYHPLHDIYNIHTEVCVFLLFTIFWSVIWLSFPKTVNSIASKSKNNATFAMLLYMFFYYATFIAVATFIDPASEISIGWHEPIGPCQEKVATRTPLGHTLYKRKYLCLTDNDENYFGWSCLPNGQSPKNGTKWYTICGIPFANRMEYIIILSTIAVFGWSFFLKTLFSNSLTVDKLNNNPEIIVNHKIKLKQINNKKNK